VALKIRARASAYAFSFSDRSVPEVVDFRSTDFLPLLPPAAAPSASEEDALLPWAEWLGVQLRLRSPRFMIFILRDDCRDCRGVAVAGVARTEPATGGELEAPPPPISAFCASSLASAVVTWGDGVDAENELIDAGGFWAAAAPYSDKSMSCSSLEGTREEGSLMRRIEPSRTLPASRTIPNLSASRCSTHRWKLVPGRTIPAAAGDPPKPAAA
jgi:hypothetical protein